MRALAHRRLARWLALAATCASLAVTGAPLREAPRFEPAAAAMVMRAPARAPRAVRAWTGQQPPAQRAFATTAAAVTASRERAQAPATRPLYLVNRSLLR